MVRANLRRTWSLVAAAVLSAALLSQGAGTVGAEPQTARIVGIENINAQWQRFTVYSPSMGRDIKLDVLRPKDRSRPAPMFYLFSGADGGTRDSSWGERTDFAEFFADKQVNVVSPLDGKASYYSNWKKVDKSLGKNEWETFMLKELPPVLEPELGATGKRAIAGNSMGGSGALNLATKAPGFYKAVGAYSACARVSDPLGQAYVQVVLETRGVSDYTNMWGPVGDPLWRKNDPYVNAAKLRGTSIFMSNSSGLPGPNERIEEVTPDELLVKGNQAVVGGLIEAATLQCTMQMENRLKQLKIPATTVYRPQGTHSWGYWGPELKASWPQISRAIH
ncbi:alpha/beta hydrolase [Gordonia sp. VNK21]|uniref:alpha/beta hydrolase n=1 Tax=Gordonia sp. VNK21 TaxID=3382483 RepID=UPI0038D509A4